MDEFLDDEESSDEDSNDDNEKKKEPWTADTDSSDDDKKKKKRPRRNSSSSDNSDDSDDDSKKSKNKKPAPKPKGRQTRNSRLTADDGELPSMAPRPTRAAMNSDDNSDDDIVTVKPKVEPKRGALRSGINFKDPSENPEREGNELKLDDLDKDWYDEFLTQEDETDMELSGKLVLLLEILADAEVVGDKVLVFSQSLVSLDLIEKCIGGGSIGGNCENWLHGVDYFRMDGSTPVQKRKRWAETFNDPDNTR